MKKILIVITTGYASYGGLTTVMMNYYRAMDKSGLHIDFASTNESPRELLDELYSNGSEYFCLGERNKNPFKYRQNLKKVLEKNKYDVIHVNGNSATMTLELTVAKKCGVPVRIAHGHNTRTSHPIINKMLGHIFRKTYTYPIAVSKLAGDWLYNGDKYIILNNAIDLKKYKFNKEIRDKVRQELKLDNKFVVGNVGKLNEQKNHMFLLRVFAELKKMRDNVCLLLVGGGHLETVLHNECKSLNIDSDVIFTGMVDNAANYFQAMDVFVFPSKWEGLPVAMIEAQANGLGIIASDTITKEVKLTDNTVYKSLKDTAELWAEQILKIEKEKSLRFDADKANLRKFDIDYEAEKLRKIYLGDL